VVEANALSVPPGKYDRKVKTQRNRRGLTQAVDHVAQFDDTRGTLPGLDRLVNLLEIEESQDTSPGAAWLSSARALKCTVKSGNERNPYSVFYMSQKTASDNEEEGGDDAKSAWPFDVLGCTHDTMEPTMGCESVSWS